MPREPIYSNWADFTAATRTEVADQLHQLTVGMAPGRRPRVQLTITADETDSARTPRTGTITVDVNRPDRGRAWLGARLPDLVRSTLPAEFLGVVRIEMEALPGPKSHRSWPVDVGTRRRHDDPVVRRVHADLIDSDRRKDAMMANMFRSSVAVIQAAGLVVEASPTVDAPVPPPQPSPLESVGRYAIDRMAEAYRGGHGQTAPQPKPDGQVDAEAPVPAAAPEPQTRFDAWSLVLPAGAEPVEESPNGVRDDLSTARNIFDDSGLRESDIVDEHLDLTSPRAPSAWRGRVDTFGRGTWRHRTSARPAPGR